MSYWRTVAWRLRQDPTTIVAGVLLLLIALAAILAPLIAPHDPSAGSIRLRLAPLGTSSHPLGTDEQGRDMLTRLLWGGRMTLLAGLTPVLVGFLFGPVLGFSSTQVSLSIILAAGLSFLGLGVTPPAAEWGLMLNTLRGSIYVNAWVPALPGVAIFLTSMAFNLLSDGLRDAMEIRM